MKALFSKLTGSLVQFEHATVVVLGAEYVLTHVASLIVVGSTCVLFIVFHLFLREP